MEWRIDEQLIRGEIDNRIPGLVTGRLWFIGREAPITLHLTGNAERDVAGHVLAFLNPAPVCGAPDGLRDFAAEQRGHVGVITASRKVRVPDCTEAELHSYLEAQKAFPWHWGNSLHLEWHSTQNGRVVIASAHYQITVSAEATWHLSAAEEQLQRDANPPRLPDFFPPSDEAPSTPEIYSPESFYSRFDSSLPPETAADPDNDAPTSAAEATAEAEQARMDLLIDRVQARLERAQAAGEALHLSRIMEEERARLRRERGEPEPLPPSEAEQADQAAWIAELNAVVEDTALDDATTSEHRVGTEGEPEQWHPLVERCQRFSEALRQHCARAGWLQASDGREHPLRELLDGVMIAGSKLAGALGLAQDEANWPPAVIFAGATLVRLKKARTWLRDARLGLDAADEQALGEATWRAATRTELDALLHHVDARVAELRALLNNAEGEA